jgi:dTDP-4-dehydrorhamnose reductase
LKILLLGKNGQLGWELHHALAPLDQITALDFEELDLGDFDAVRRKVRALRPELIVNAAAYTAVDRAENEPDKAYAINAAAPGILAEESKSMGAALIHYSTDYVFDGARSTPYTETDSPNPINVYGASKLAGEQAIQAALGDYLIFRTAWVYSLRGDSFVTKVLKWARANETLRIVDDQVSNPTWAGALAEITAQLLASGSKDFSRWIAEHKGLYHLAGSGFASRFEWAKEILRLDPQSNEQIVNELLPAPTSDFPAPAQRPLFSALECNRFMETFSMALAPWQAALRHALTLDTSTK